MVSAHPLEAKLRTLAPLGGSDNGPGDPVALQSLSDRTGLSAGVLGRCFVLQSARCEVHVLSPDTRPPIRILCSPAPLFPLSGLALSPDSAQLALFGVHGVCCISVTALDSCGPADTASRRPAMLLDLSGDRAPASVSRVLWLSKTTVLVLLSDNTARRFHSCLAAVDPSRIVTRPPSAVIKLAAPPTRQGAALREFAVDAVVVGDSPELLFLIGSGEVLWGTGDNVEREPLRWTPAAVDNYGCDFCCLLCLNAGPLRVLIVGTTTGQLFHCLLLRSKTDAPPQLVVFDAVDLSLPSTALQLRLIPDRLQPHRYFALHNTGLHVVHLPWLPQLAALYEQQEPPSTEHIVSLPSSLVEHALCLKPLQSSRSNVPVAFLQLGPPAATRLLCVLQNGDVVTCTVRCPLPPERKEPTEAPSTSPATSKAAAAAEGELVLQLKRLFTAETFQPLLHSANASADGREALELVQRAAAVIARQYLQPLDAARALLARRLEVLTSRRAAQAQQLKAIAAEQREAGVAAKKLLERAATAESRGEHLRAAMGRASDCLGALLPRRMSRSEERAASEARRLRTRVAGLQAWTERTEEKRSFCAKIQPESLRQPSAEGKGSGLQVAVSKKLRAVLQDEGERIGDLIARLQTLQTQVATT